MACTLDPHNHYECICVGLRGLGDQRSSTWCPLASGRVCFWCGGLISARFPECVDQQEELDAGDKQ